MDFQRFGIDPRLAQAAEGLTTSFFYYEKMLALAVEKEENVCARISLDEGREEVILLPALQWLLSGEGRKLLVGTSDEEGAGRFAAALGRLGSAAGIGFCRVRPPSGGEPAPAGAPAIEGSPEAPVLIGQPELLIASALPLRDYGFLVLDGLDKIAELSAEAIRKFAGTLLPAWERRSILACDKLSVKAKNLAWDLADNPAELSVEGEAAKAESVLKETWSVPGESKMKFLLGLLSREPSPRVCVFCNLRDSAEELSRRLVANGVASDYILGALAQDRKRAVLEKVKAGTYRCLVLTDQGAEGLELGAFPLVVNFDIPLEPELFVKRLEMLDRGADGAKLVSIACERYVYGLPAVESYIDARLEALPVSEGLLAAEDKSEGMSISRQARPEARGDARPRQEGGRGNQGRRDDRGRSRDGRSYGRGGDRSPDIRKSISEATGGALDMNSSSPLPGSSSARHESAPRGGQGGRGEGQGGKQRSRNGQGGERRGQGGGEERGSRRGQGGSPRQHDQRGPSSQRPAQQRGGAPRQAQAGNPYDTPIEERMKLYREKYGQSLGGEGERGPRQGQGGQSAAKGGSRQERSQGRPESRQAREAPPEAKPAQTPSVIGRLFGAFKKKH